MKTLEFETSKGKFLVSESDEHYDYRFIGLLSRITEEQASEIVDEIHGNVSFITTLNILLKSKGIHLFENPIPPFYERLEDFKQAEQKTFYNPYIFKL